MNFCIFAQIPMYLSYTDECTWCTWAVLRVIAPAACALSDGVFCYHEIRD